MTGDIFLMATIMPNSKVSSMLTLAECVSRNVRDLVFDDVVADIVLLVEDLTKKYIEWKTTYNILIESQE